MKLITYKMSLASVENVHILCVLRHRPTPMVCLRGLSRIRHRRASTQPFPIHADHASPPSPASPAAHTPTFRPIKRQSMTGGRKQSPSCSEARKLSSSKDSWIAYKRVMHMSFAPSEIPKLGGREWESDENARIVENGRTYATNA